MTHPSAASSAQTATEADRSDIAAACEALNDQADRAAVMRLCREVMQTITGYRVPVQEENDGHEVFPESVPTERIVSMVRCLLGFYVEPCLGPLPVKVHDAEAVEIAAACRVFLGGQEAA